MTVNRTAGRYGPPESSPLTGYVVVDLSSGIAGAYCAKLLADAGARVVAAEPPEGNPLRGRSVSGAILENGADGALFQFLAGGAHSVVADPAVAADRELLDRLLTNADAVVWSPGPGAAGDPGYSPAALRERHPHLVVTAITPFGLDGPWTGRPATEFTLQAWSGGIVGLGRGAPDRAPLYIGGDAGEWFAGAYAAAALLTARQRALTTATGELVDLSMLETQILGLSYYPVSFYETVNRPFRTRRRLSRPGVATAADGLIAVGCGTAQQWFDLCVMVGHPEWIEEDPTPAITERTNEKAAEIAEWFAAHKVDEIRELATAFRIPNSPVADGANVTEFDQHLARDFFTVNPRGGFVQPGPPFRTLPALLREPTPAPRLGEHTEHYRSAGFPGRPARTGIATSNPLPFRGLRVLDMTTFWAGPSCTHFLAMQGAEVIHVESAQRPDGTRLIAGVPIDEDRWWEKSGIFTGLNTGKRGITVDFRTAAGREILRRLVASCEVIVENYTPRVIEQIGLDWETVRRLRPDAVMVRMPGFGIDGPWRDNPAFAYVIEDASGLTARTGYPDQNPVEPYSLGDPNAGVHALIALLLALEHRRRTGAGVLVEAAMVDAALNITAEQVIEYSAYGALLERTGNRGPHAAPQNLYRAAGLDEFGRPDNWVALAVTTDEQWAALVEILEQPVWAADPGLRTVAGRRKRHDEIDVHLASWFADREVGEIVSRLWAAGIPVAEVLQPHRQGEIPQLHHRNFFEAVPHPVNPSARHSTVPARFSAGPGSYHRSPAPLLGQDNHAVLTELGYSADEISVLERAEVVGGTPRF
ncbi:CaiB/BaiF CoA-transferase family protein [Nocardia jinanensis]|uniref:CoA transferase n=1 Tax=Nocardia jinanensis TaxID=382504 RepID=A0A917RPP7_9NOCA|nr:CoA transferase [Nocardia jinanensis]GGL17844.1 CoA transferase [Nocardia jinanensis]